jgi:hypothetical protein
VAPWNLVDGFRLTSKSLYTTPRFGGAFLGVFARHYALSQSLMTHMATVSSVLHSRNIEFWSGSGGSPT